MNKNIYGDIIYPFHHLSTDELKNHPNALEKVYNRSFTGLLIKNVLNKSEIASLLQSLETTPKEEKIQREEVVIYPRGFAAYTDNPVGEAQDGMKVYFENGSKYIENFPNHFNLDFHKKIKEIFEKIGGGRRFEFLQDSEKHGHFTPSQFRSFLPGYDALPIHCGNVFQHHYAGFYNYLKDFAAIKNQMSYFIMLQKPDEGGELVLFDLLFEKGQLMKPFYHVVLPDGTEIEPLADEQMKKMVIDPEPGDMIIFAGGEVWHKVLSIIGSKPRITIGGFFTFSIDGNKVHSWA